MIVVITENKTKRERVKGDDIKMFKGQKFFNITGKVKPLTLFIRESNNQKLLQSRSVFYVILKIYELYLG